MAQAIVQTSWVKLKSAIEDEVMRRLNFTSDLEEMLKALEDVKPLLHDAESRSLRQRHPEPEVRKWVGRVRKNAYLISDMVDELQETRRTSPAAGKVTRILPCLGPVSKRNQMADNMKQTMEELRKILEELRKIVLESGNFGLTPSEPSADPVIDVPAVEEEKILGRDEQIKSIMDACNTSEGPVIIPIYGEEGSGKRAFARMVFNHTRFRHHSRVWVHELQGHSLHNIRNCIISQLSGGVETVNNHGSSNEDIEYKKKRLHELIRDSSMKVLVVLDGLHLEYSKRVEFKRMFGVGDSSSKVTVILISRNFKGTEFCTVYPIELTELNDDMCWTIIKQTSGFEGRPGPDKEKLEQIGPEIAEKCWGSPRKAKVFGAMLRYKDATEWSEVLSSEFWDEVTEKSSMNSFLKIAYSMMPSNLRLCYAYCAIFPKGHTMVKDYLIHQWIALGLIEPSDRFSTRQLAEEYIRSLVDLSLLQIMEPASTSANDGKGSVLYSVHEVRLPLVKDLLRNCYVEGLHDEFIRLEGTTSETCYKQEYVAPHCSVKEKIQPEYGRYAVLTDFDATPSELWRLLLPQLRAIHSLRGSKMEFTDNSFSSARWLRVLELKEHSMQKLPESVCQLTHLRCLNLSGCYGLVTLPDSFGDLVNLVYIDLSRCSKLKSLPKSLGGKRAYLENIDLSGCCGLETLPESFGKLINLIRINLSGCSDLVSLPRSLGKLINLEHLGLSGCSGLVSLPWSFGKLINLKHVDLSGCSGLASLPWSFGKLINLEHVSLSGCSGLESLPRSFGKLINLEHVGLSGCSGLESLPRSFGKLKKLPHINLSGCSRLVSLPKSFGELRNLVRVDLSGCSGLLSLPQSFGNLINLLYIDLSHCHALVDLPQSFRKLEKLQHLNLSFWSCSEVIRTALDGLTSLQHLDLSHPCSSNAQHQAQHLQLVGLQETFKKLTSLQYLNLSMFFHSRSEKEIAEDIQVISVLSNLEHLDLSHNMFLGDVPESLAVLSKLHTLDLSGCIRLKTVPDMIYEMGSLKLIVLRHCRGLKIYQFVVGADDCRGNLDQLEYVNCQEMEISCLEKVKTVNETRSIRFREKGHLVKLKLCWTLGSKRVFGDTTLLGQLVPPHSLQCLELRGYWGGQMCLCDVGWWKPTIGPNLLNLEQVTLEDVWTCATLPPLGRLPNLQQLVLRRITTITRIDARDLCFGNRPALRRLTIDDMPYLRTFITRYHGGVDDSEELMFPAVDELSVTKCPWLMFVPLPPQARRLELSGCEEVMSASWCTGGGRGVEGPPCTAAAPVVTELVVKSCRDWKLLHHLHGLRSLTISKCSSLDSLPAALSSLQILCFSVIYNMTSLPQNLGDLNSLRELWIDDCGMVEFPNSMQQLTSLESIHLSSCARLEKLPEWLGKLANLKDLYIWDCYYLMYWCKEETSKNILSHIRLKYEKFVSPESGTQSLQYDDPKGDTSNIGYGNGAGGDDSIQMHPILAPSTSRGPNGLGSLQRDIYLT